MAKAKQKESSSTKVTWEFPDRFLESLYGFCEVKGNEPEDVLMECFTSCGMLMMERKFEPACRPDGSFVWVKSGEW